MTDELYNILMEPERLARQIKRKKLEIEAIEAAVYPAGIRYDRDKVQTSPRDDQIPSVLAKTEPLKKDLDRLTKRYQKAVALRSSLLDKVDQEAADIILAKLTGHCHWDELERKFHYSRRQLGRIYSRGLNDLENARLLSHFF